MVRGMTGRMGDGQADWQQVVSQVKVIDSKLTALTKVFATSHRPSCKVHNHHRDKTVRNDGIHIQEVYFEIQVSNLPWNSLAILVATYFPQVAPQDTFSCKHFTLATTFLPQAQVFLVKNGHGGHGVGSSWHEWWVLGCPHASGGREHG